MSSTLNVQKRVTISLALHRYLRAVDRFEDASNEFNEACKAIRSSLPKPSRFVAQVSHQNYLVTSDQDGNFEVDQIDLV